jgi:hypothetical protein
MNLNPIAAYLTPTLLRRCAALTLTLAAIGACSDDEEAPAPQPEFSLAVTSLDGRDPAEAVELSCDGNLVVAVAISTSIKSIPFTLRPAGACGTSKRCGYLRVEALAAGDELLGRAETTTSAAVLPLPLERLDDVAAVRATLMSGVDKTPILNKDGSEVSTSVSLTSLTVQGDCPEPGGSAGAGGAAGQGGAAGNGGAGAGPIEGGAGGAASGGAAGGGQTAGAGGAPDAVAGGGAGGEPTGAGAADPGS